MFLPKNFLKNKFHRNSKNLTQKKRHCTLGPGLFLPIFLSKLFLDIFFQKGSKSSEVNTTNTHFSKNFPPFFVQGRTKFLERKSLKGTSWNNSKSKLIPGNNTVILPPVSFGIIGHQPE
jgi:hypothetical protein